MPTKRGYARQMRDALLGVLLVYLAFIGILTFIQRDMMYFPPMLTVVNMAELENFEAVQLQTEDSLTLKAYFVPPKPKKPVLVLYHGNASHPSWEAFKTQHLRAQGYGVLLTSYRGYDGNPGEPSEAGFFLDAKASLDFIKKSAPEHPIIIYGESIGSGVAVEAATQVQPLAVVLEVPFLSAVDAAQRFYPYIPFIDKLMRDPYRNDLKIQKIKAPILFLLAGKDNVVTLDSGLALYELANSPKEKVVFAGASHVNVYQHGAQDHLVKFLEKVSHD